MLCCNQVDAKLSEELLRQELLDQQAESSASWCAQLRQQQGQIDTLESSLTSQLVEVQAGLKALTTQLNSKVRCL